MRRIIFTLILISLVLFSRAVFSYDDKTTHPALTDEAVDFYNETLRSPAFISSEEKEWIVQGSILEDTEPRYINHFYDPVYNQGWTGEKGYDWVSEGLMQKFSDVFFSSQSSITAINWVHNQELQTKYQRYLGNRTWEKAIYEYVKNNNKKEAFLSLGHVLHLLEDMTVPEHTRNDTHPNDSPYENYSKQFTRDTLNVVNEYKAQNFQPTNFNTLDEYFESLAVYSNNYFFSKDTIGVEKYNKPAIIRDDGKYGYGLDRNQIEFPMSLVNRQWDKEKDTYKTLYLLDKNEPQYYPILSAYWTRLSRAAVLGGAGVIKLFFDEVEKAEKDPSLLQVPPENQSSIISAWGEMNKAWRGAKDVKHRVFNKIKGWAEAVNLFSQPAAVYEASMPFFTPSSETTKETTENIIEAPVSDLVLAENNQSASLPPLAPSTPPAPSTLPSVLRPTPVELPPPPNPLLNIQPVVAVPKKPAPTPIPAIPSPWFGGGSIESSYNANNQVNPVTQQQESLSQDDALSLSSSNSSDSSVSENSTSSVTMADDLETDSETNATTTLFSTDSATSTEIVLNATSTDSVVDATTTIPIIEPVATTTATTTESTVDTTIPIIDSFSILECAKSFSSDGCLIGAVTVSLTWQSQSDDMDYFELSYGENISTTTATSTIINLSDNSDNLFSIKAKDKAGNWSDAKTASVEISSMPVVINEIAWGGTGPNHSQDEWMELYNRTSKPVNLNNWVLYSQSDLKPYVNLSGTIPAKGYYLIERTDDNTVSDVAADWTGSFGSGTGAGLSNLGEVIALSYASTTIDQTPNSGSWPVTISNSRYRSMERYDPDAKGDNGSNWGSNNMIIINGKSAGPEFSALNATPKARNSINYQIINQEKQSLQISSDIKLTKANSPYLVNSQALIFKQGSSLTIEPGVKIYFYKDASLLMGGKIIAQGTEAEPIIFDGGFGDNPDYWFGITVSSEGSVFDHAVFRRGGRYYYGATRANLTVENVAINITNSIFENSKIYGLQLINSSSVVSNNIFRDNNFENDSAGYDSAILINSGSPTIQSNTFSNNHRGIYMVTTSGGKVDSNYFDSNSKGAIYALNSVPVFSNNSGVNNSPNAIQIVGRLTSSGVDATLKANSLAYVLTGGNILLVAASSTLTIEKGAVVKGDILPLSVDGNLVIGGDNPEDIIFTSVADDSAAGDTNNNGNLSSPQPGQFPGIAIGNSGSLNAKGFTMRYAGNNRFNGNYAGIMINGGVADIANALFDNNYTFGLWAYNSPNITISNVRFENHNFSSVVAGLGSGAAVSVLNSVVNLSNVSFTNNFLGVLANTASSFITSGVDFTNNTATTSPANLF